MNSGVRFFLATMAVVILLIFGIVLINRSGGRSNGETITGVSLTELADKQGSSVQMVTEGPINAASDHRTIRMTVSARTAQIDIIAGYEGQVITTKSYDNNPSAYSEFLNALARAGFTKERRMENPSADAICPLGNRTHYRVLDGSDVKQNSWNASCTKGTFTGNVSLTNSLFQSQFPDYSTVTNGINLNNTPPSTGLVL